MSMRPGQAKGPSVTVGYSSVVDDHKVHVDGADTVANYLDPKIAVAGGLTKTVLNPGGDEQLQISGASVTGDHLVIVNPADVSASFLFDYATYTGKIASEGISLETHDNGAGVKQLNIYQVPGWYDGFNYVEPFWQGTYAITSGDWVVSTGSPLGYMRCVASSSSFDWIRAGVYGDVDYCMGFDPNAATVCGFRITDGINEAQILWDSSGIIFRRVTGQADATVAYAFSDTVYLRIKKTGPYIRFFYRHLNTEPWTDMLQSAHVEMISDILLELYSETTVIGADLIDVALFDALMPKQVGPTRDKYMPVINSGGGGGAIFSIIPRLADKFKVILTHPSSNEIYVSPLLTVADGSIISMYVYQDGTGGRDVNFNDPLVFPASVSPGLAFAGAPANAWMYLQFRYNETSGKYVCILAQYSEFKIPYLITGVNVGAGSGLLFKQKDADGDMEFKSLLAGAGVVLTNNTSDVTIAAQALPEFQFFGDQFQVPNNADWPLNALAPMIADPANNAIPVVSFADGVASGVGFQVEIPSSASNLTLAFRGRAQTAPGVAKTVQLKLYDRSIPNNAAVTAWDAGTLLTAFDIPANAYFQYDTQTIALATLGLTAGTIVQFELTRPVGDTLASNYLLNEMKVSFS